MAVTEPLMKSHTSINSDQFTLLFMSSPQNESITARTRLCVRVLEAWDRLLEAHLVNLKVTLVFGEVELLRAFVHGEIDMSSESLDANAMPVLVIQQAA